MTSGIRLFDTVEPNDFSREDIASAEKLEEMKRVQDAEDQARAIGFYHLFTSPDGAAFLDLLRSLTVDLSLMNVQAVIGTDERQIPINPAEWAYLREGQNSVYRWISSEMNKAEAYMRQPNDQRQTQEHGE